MAFAGIRGTDSFAANERPQDFRALSLWRNPASTPLFALMARVKKQVTTDPQFNWWDEPNDNIRLQINNATGYVSTDTTLVVDGTDPSTTNPSINYGSALNLVPGDILMVLPSVDSSSFTPEYIQVVSVASATTFTVTRGVAGSTAGVIADNTALLKTGNAFSEGSPSAGSSSNNPIQYFNYTQIFKTACQVSGTAENTETRTGDVMKNEISRKAFRHSQGLEFAFLFGNAYQTTGSNGLPLRFTAGLRAQIPPSRATILANGWTIANSATAGNNFLDAVAPVFDFASPAGDQRVILAGNGAINAFNQAISKGSGLGANTIRFTGNVAMYGMQFQEFTLPQGVVRIKNHPLMSRDPFYTNSMFVVDFSSLQYRYLKNRDTKLNRNIQAPGDDLTKNEWLTEAGIEVDYGGLTCGYIGGFNNTIG